VVNSSAGASEHIQVAQANLAQAIDQLKKRGIWIVGMEDRPDALLPEQVLLDGPLAIVVGSEGSGIRQLVRRSCDVIVRLPMQGRIPSYNAAVAGSILLYLQHKPEESPNTPSNNY